MLGFDDFAKGIGSGLANIATGAISNALGLTMSQGEAMRKAWEYEKEGMGLQYQYGQQAADAQQQRNLEMWNKTNFEAQRQHMENAGLSVGLMYGNGGAMAASSAGGSPTQPSGPTTNPVALGLQAEAVQSQIALANAQATKAYAEAKKISGVDTEEGYSRIGVNDATIGKLAAETENEKQKKALITAQTRTEQTKADLNEVTINYTEQKKNESMALVGKLKEETNLLLQEINGVKVDNYIKIATMGNVIEQQQLATAQMIKNLTKTNVEIEEIQMKIGKMTLDYVLGAEGNAIKWAELENDLTKFLAELGVKEELVKLGYYELFEKSIKDILDTAVKLKGMDAMKEVTGNKKETVKTWSEYIGKKIEAAENKRDKQ